MSREATLGLDLGTGSLKAVVVDREGRVVGTASAGYPIETPRPGWSETDPARWWDAAVQATREVIERCGRPAIAAVGVAGQMHGHTLVDAALRPVSRAILWSDDRAAGMEAELRSLDPVIRERIANPFVAGASGATLPWLARNDPAMLAAARWSLQPKDQLRTHLVDEPPATDASDASATLLWDVPGDRWSDEAIAALGIRRELLPPVRDPVERAGALTAAAATTLGLDAGIPVAIGAADAAAAAIGTGLLEPGRVQLTAGTGTQAFVLRSSAAPDPAGRVHRYRSALAGQWYAMAAVQNGGLALDWVRRLLGVDWAAVFGAIDPAGPRDGDPVFVPNLTRERPQQVHPGPGGAFLDLQLHHDRDALLRAAVEGVALGIRLAVDCLPEANATDTLVLAGGGGMDAAYRQLLADVLGRDLVNLHVDAASGRGAGLIAGVTAGWWPDLRATAGLTDRTGLRTASRPAAHRAWNGRLERFLAASRQADALA